MIGLLRCKSNILKTCLVHYLNNNTFNDGETLTVEGSTTQANTVSSAGASGITGATGNGAVVSIDSGVFYAGGFFVFKDAETLILEKYSSTPSYRVGIQITESVVTSDGDGSLLMHMGSLRTNANFGGKNFKHIMLNNNAHESVGGQPTSAEFIDMPGLVKANGYTNVFFTENEEELLSQIGEFMKKKGPCFLDVKIKPGSREDLGRPTVKPVDNKKAFMKFVREK